jgi:hypothetical protein
MYFIALVDQHTLGKYCLSSNFRLDISGWTTTHPERVAALSPLAYSAFISTSPLFFSESNGQFSFDLIGPGVLPDRVATIDANRGSGNEVRSPRRQEHSRSSHFLRLTPSPSRSPGKNLVVHGLHGRCSYRRSHIRLNPSWCDCVHLNVVWGEFNGH